MGMSRVRVRRWKHVLCRSGTRVCWRWYPDLSILWVNAAFVSFPSACIVLCISAKNVCWNGWYWFDISKNTFKNYFFCDMILLFCRFILLHNFRNWYWFFRKWCWYCGNIQIHHRNRIKSPHYPQQFLCLNCKLRMRMVWNTQRYL